MREGGRKGGGSKQKRRRRRRRKRRKRRRRGEGGRGVKEEILSPTNTEGLGILWLNMFVVASLQCICYSTSTVVRDVWQYTNQVGGQ